MPKKGALKNKRTQGKTRQEKLALKINFPEPKPAKKKARKVKKAGQPKIPTFALMKAFENYSRLIRGAKPNFTRLKDGNLIKSALKHLSPFQIEMLFVWFLKERKNMQPAIGGALCKEVISGFINASRRQYGFYGNLEKLARQCSNTGLENGKARTEAEKMAKALEELKTELSKKFKPFSRQTRAQLAEETAAEERKQFTPTP